MIVKLDIGLDIINKVIQMKTCTQILPLQIARIQVQDLQIARIQAQNTQNNHLFLLCAFKILKHKISRVMP
jgi:hypothetical protein